MEILLGVIILGLCHQQVASVHVTFMKNRKLDSQYKVSVSGQTALGFCAEKCVMYSDCLSFSYAYVTKVCELYSEDSTTASSGLIETNNVVFVDIRDWTQGKAVGVCSGKPCGGNNTQCVPDGQSFHCGIREPDKFCPPFNLPEHGLVHNGNNTNVTAGAIILLKCEPPYITTLVGRSVSWVQKCGVDGEWSGWTYQCHTVAELCNETILDSVNVTVHSGNGDLVLGNLLLSSSTGVTLDTYLEIRFLDNAYWIGGVSTKGATVVDGIGQSFDQWVTSYSIQYKTSCNKTNYRDIDDPNTTTPKVFVGNGDVNTEVQYIFDDPINVNCLRIVPITFKRGATMRVGLLRCTTNETD